MIDKYNRTAEVTASIELPFIYRYEIIGLNGSVTVDSAFRPDALDKQLGKVTVRDDNGNVILFETNKDYQYLRQIVHFHECILEGKNPNYNTNHSLEISCYLEKSYRSFHSNSVLMDVN